MGRWVLLSTMRPLRLRLPGAESVRRHSVVLFVDSMERDSMERGSMIHMESTQIPAYLPGFSLSPPGDCSKKEARRGRQAENERGGRQTESGRGDGQTER